MVKRMILREQENVFLSEFGRNVPAVPTCLFRHNLCRRSLPTWRKVIPIHSLLLQSKIFLMYLMWNNLTKRKIHKKLLKF